jgi:hypothetical protein
MKLLYLLKLEEIEPEKADRLKWTHTAQNVSIESLTAKKKSISPGKETAEANTTNFSNSLETSSNIRAQNVVEQVGHFKYFRDGKIFINFIDKVKLFMDEASTRAFLNRQLDRSFCFIYLPDGSEHELCLAAERPNFFFAKYVAFLEQWVSWLVESKYVQGDKQQPATSSQNSSLSSADLQMHLNQLKLFNFTREQQSSTLDASKTTNESADLSHVSVSSLLRQNNQFLSEISK